MDDARDDVREESAKVMIMGGQKPVTNGDVNSNQVSCQDKLAVSSSSYVDKM